MAQVPGWVRRPVRMAAVDDDGRGDGGGMFGGADVGGEGGESVVQVRDLYLIVP